MQGLFFLRVNVEFSLKINNSILFHPLRVVGGIEKGGGDQRLRRNEEGKKETGEGPRELREGGEENRPSVLHRQKDF